MADCCNVGMKRDPRLYDLTNIVFILEYADLLLSSYKTFNFALFTVTIIEGYYMTLFSYVLVSCT